MQIQDGGGSTRWPAARPHRPGQREHGLILANLTCDLIRLHTTASATTIRLYLHRQN